MQRQLLSWVLLSQVSFLLHSPLLKGGTTNNDRIKLVAIGKSIMLHGLIADKQSDVSHCITLFALDVTRERS